MQTTERTPRPWRIGDAGVSVFGPKTDAPSPVTIAAGLRNKANVRLIAASPDLLSAAKDALESLSRLPDTDGAFRVTCMEQLHKAIARAEG